ncbi:exocyst complex component 3-like [Condylostylus longicornis]|uniref:exocyst complex component 3-like n=1 Tax=Condylostylus longicornis TaxID=2530218 RepID=UPI00244E2037|nr:exocyst complex component 3-like [Condylostylus longicornis]
MNMKHLEDEARKAALNEIKNMFKTPSQLEKLSEYKRRAEMKKASADALLKSKIQNQLESVKVGIKQLKVCLSEVQDATNRVYDVNNLLEPLPITYNNLEDFRSEVIKYAQYGTAMEHLTNIANIEEKVKKTLQFIEDDKLLDAHQCLHELEISRDDLLYEVHIEPEKYSGTVDKITLRKYFDKVDLILQRLQEKIRLILSRCLHIVRIKPTMIVTTLRIIEREENSDEYALQQQKFSGFLPPGRPKKWRDMAMNILYKGVVDRIEGSKLENRSEKLWLVKDLEITRKIILNDLRLIKSLCTPCFPPDYNIFHQYIKFYHKALANYLNRIIKSKLEGNEYVTLLSWILNTYNGSELMSHSDLKIDSSKITGPLLQPEQLKKLETDYLEIIERNYQEWMNNILEKEKEEWLSKITEENMFQENYGEFYLTSAPFTIFEMIKEHLEVTNTISADITFDALLLSMRRMEIFAQNYRSDVTDFKYRHLKNYYQIKYFQDHIIAVINNNLKMIELSRHLKLLYWPQSQAKHYENFKRLIKTFQTNSEEAAVYLVEDAFIEIESIFNELFTSKWLQDRTLIKSICKTLDKSFSKFIHLKPDNLTLVMNIAQKMLTMNYIKALLSKRLSKQLNEIEIITPIDLILALSDILIADIELLVLDLTTLLGNYPSISEDHILRLFYIRSDIKPAIIREKIHDAMQAKKSPISTAKCDDIFKEITFNNKLW